MCINVGVASYGQLRKVLHVGAQDGVLTHAETVTAGRVEEVAHLFVVNFQVADLDRKLAAGTEGVEK